MIKPPYHASPSDFCPGNFAHIKVAWIPLCMQQILLWFESRSVPFNVANPLPCYLMQFPCAIFFHMQIHRKNPCYVNFAMDSH